MKTIILSLTIVLTLIGSQAFSQLGYNYENRSKYVHYVKDHGVMNIEAAWQSQNIPSTTPSYSNFSEPQMPEYNSESGLLYKEADPVNTATTPKENNMNIKNKFK